MKKTLPGLKPMLLSGALLVGYTANVLAQSAQAKTWSAIAKSELPAQSSRKNLPATFKAFSLDVPAIATLLASAPIEGTEAARQMPLELELPAPNGQLAKFRLVEAPIMAPELAARYPQIKTYAGQGITDRAASLRLDITPEGLHAQVLTPEGAWYIDPYTAGNSSQYMSYRKADLQLGSEATYCHFSPSPDLELEQSLAVAQKQRENNAGHNAMRSNGSQLRTYRLALACTGEYAATKGGTKAGALAGMVTSMNRVNGIYEVELAVRMVLIGNTDTLIYLSGSTDPYTNNNGGTMLGQNQTTVDNIIGAGNYDVGHVFSTGGGGIAGLGVPCRGGQKARGVTGLTNPTGDAFDVDYVAHEMGHQFGGNHTFNGSAGSCNGNGNPGTAYEPGSGTTIMAYAGICAPQNIQNNSNAYFHTASFDEMVTYTNNSFGNTCPATTSTGNTPPVVEPGTTYYIPYKTAFVLKGQASDPDGDAITYCFEQYDKGPFGSPSNPSGNAPIYRSYSPNANNFRYFPRLQNVVLNNLATGERYPDYERTMHFRLTARDNRANGGGVTYGDVPFTVWAMDFGQPFMVTYPNAAGVSWTIGDQHTVTWDVAGSDQAPVSTNQVNIMLSVDGGLTMIDTLAMNVPNTGSYTVTVPNHLSSTARIIIYGAGNIFYDMSNANFVITNVSATEDDLLAAGVNLFPNPTDNEFNLTLPADVQGPVNIQLADVTGRVISTQVLTNDVNTLTHTINLSAQAKGVYTVSVSTAKAKTVKRLVKL